VWLFVFKKRSKTNLKIQKSYVVRFNKTINITLPRNNEYNDILILFEQRQKRNAIEIVYSSVMIAWNVTTNNGLLVCIARSNELRLEPGCLIRTASVAFCSIKPEVHRISISYKNEKSKLTNNDYNQHFSIEQQNSHHSISQKQSSSKIAEKEKTTNSTNNSVSLAY
jgi:hypothetical protein